MSSEPASPNRTEAGRAGCETILRVARDPLGTSRTKLMRLGRVSNVWFGTRRSVVRIRSPRPKLSTSSSQAGGLSSVKSGMASTLPADIRAHILSHGQILHDAVELIRPAPAHWHTTLLVELATEEYANCLELIDGVDKINLAKTAWAARNLLELHYFIRYVSTSPERRSPASAEDVVLRPHQSLLNQLGMNPQYSPISSHRGQPIVDQYGQKADRGEKGGPIPIQPKIAQTLARRIRMPNPISYFLKNCVHPKTSPIVQFRKANPEFHNLVIWGIVETAGCLFAATVSRVQSNTSGNTARLCSRPKRIQESGLRRTVGGILVGSAPYVFSLLPGLDKLSRQEGDTVVIRTSAASLASLLRQAESIDPSRQSMSGNIECRHLFPTQILRLQNPPSSCHCISSLIARSL